MEQPHSMLKFKRLEKVGEVMTNQKKLTLKQKKFADYYIKTGNATESAIKAGYSKKHANTNASKLLQNTTIREYIDNKMKKLEESMIADQKEVLSYLTSVLRGEIKEEILKDDGMGTQVIVESATPIRERTKAAELLGKRYSLWTDKVDMQGNVNIIFEDDYGDDVNDD